jgi:proline dehydrogenase
MMRKALLWASENQTLRGTFPKYRFAQAAVRKFMPGEKVEDALREAKRLNELGAGTLLTRLGENVLDKAAAQEVADHYSQVFATLATTKLRAEISVKPTQLGLDFSKEECERHLHALIERARALNNWVWIDMESTAYTDVTLEIYRRARERFPNTGLCVQAYLYRTAEDLKPLIALGSGVRLVKGAYKEPADKAFPKKGDVDENYFQLSQMLLSPEARAKGVRAIFGTHDPILIRRLEEHGRAQKLPASALEFQMLYGIRRDLQRSLVAGGYPFRVYVPFGTDWFPYFMRRLGERPANVGFVVKGLLREED